MRLDWRQAGPPSSETHSEGVMRASRFPHAFAMVVEVGAPTEDAAEPGVDEVALAVPNRPVELEADRRAVAHVVDVGAPGDGVAAAPAAPVDVGDRRLLVVRRVRIGLERAPVGLDLQPLLAGDVVLR